MSEEFCLSEKINDFRDSHQNSVTWLEVKDVKEFIRLLKDFNMKVGTHSKGVWQREINALAGEVLR